MKNSASFLRFFLPALLVLLFASVVGFSFYGHDARPLSTEALNSAQIARNIAAGHGFSTDVLLPQDDSHTLAKPLQTSPSELLHAPLFPTLLGTVFSAMSESDNTLSAASLALFVLSAVLLFVLAARLLEQVALPLIIALAYATSLSALAVGNSGQPQALGTCLLLLFLLALTPKNSAATTETDDDGDVFGPRPRRFSRPDFLIGCLAALCFLNDYLSIFLIVPLLGLWLPREARARGAAVGWLLGFALVCLPWWIRNARLTGNPGHSAEWLLLAGQAGSFQDWSSGLISRLTGFLSALPSLPHLLLAPFVLVSVWIRSQNALVARRETAVLWAAAIYIAALVLLGHRDPSELMPLAPLFCWVGFTTFAQVLANAFRDNAVGKKMVRSLLFEPSDEDPTFYIAVPSKALKSWRFQDLRLRFQRLLRLPIWLRKTESEETIHAGKYPLQSVFQTRTAALLLLLLSVPWLSRALAKADRRTDARAGLQPLAKAVKKERVIVTDAPQAVAWYVGRRAMLLPVEVATVLTPEAANVGAIFLSGQPLETNLQPWRALYEGIPIPGYQRVGAQSNNALYLRQPSLEESRRAAKSNPQSAAALSELGQNLLQKNQPREALAAFEAAQRASPRDATILAATGIAYLNLKDPQNAQKQFGAALKIAPRSYSALMGLAQLQQAGGQTAAAIASYQQVLSDSPEDAVALNNLANLYADAQPLQKANLFRALEMARRAAARNPGNASILDTLGWTCFRLGYREEALKILQQAAKLAPKNSTIVGHLARVKG